MEVKSRKTSYRILLLPLLFALTCVGIICAGQLKYHRHRFGSVGSSRRGSEDYPH